ncbi:hypothetical protein SAMN05216480_10942 [Pustulibacterium marinum]|uniref:Uncharacterized protein n=1 Tax=Pustulibacterium marinum TaxID=1224947 RepID=A0A1I7HGB2_9FLAO|nr:hypothetical protein [Pustulibacterium marinum]SFU59755.1 hypothetical protein SAMN05216480_10942 [Pustulibacterium marinum]
MSKLSKKAKGSSLKTVNTKSFSKTTRHKFVSIPNEDVNNNRARAYEYLAF